MHLPISEQVRQFICQQQYPRHTKASIQRQRFDGKQLPLKFNQRFYPPIVTMSTSHTGHSAVLVAQTAIRFFTFVLAALRGSLGLVVQLSCMTDVSMSHVLLVERFVLAVLK